MICITNFEIDITDSFLHTIQFGVKLSPPLDLRPQPGEVEAIYEFPVEHVFRPESYQIRGRDGSRNRASYFLEYNGATVTVTTSSTSPKVPRQ